MDTLRDRLDRQRSGQFVARQSEKALFAELLQTHPFRYQLLYIHGPGGRGKSWLLGELADEAKTAGAAVALVDCSDVLVPAAILTGFRQQLDDAKGLFARFRKFDKARDKYWKTIAKLKTHAGAERMQGSLDLATSVASDVAKERIGAAIGATAGAAFGPVGAAVGAIAGAGIESGQAAIATLLKQGLTVGEARLVVEGEQTLTEAFIEGLADLSQTRPVVLLIDTYEAANTFTDIWLRQSLLRHLPGDAALLVLCCREPMHDRDWLRLGPAIKDIPLSPFSPGEIQTYLSARLGTHAPSSDLVYSKTAGSPLIAAMLVDGLLSNPTATALSAPHDKIADTVSWLLTGIPEEHTKDIERCAVPRHFNDRVFRYLYSDRQASAHFDTLAQYGSLFRTVPGGLAMHDDVRVVMLAHLRWKDRQSYNDLHKKVAALYDADIQSGRDQPEINELDLLVWRIERLYHRLSAGDYTSLEDANSIVDLGRSRHRRSIIAACIQILSLVHELEDAEPLSTWLQLYKGILAFESGDWASARTQWIQLRAGLRTGQDPKLYFHVNLELGRLSFHQGRFSEALECLEAAQTVSIDFADDRLQHTVNASCAADIYRQHGQWERASEIYTRSLAYFKQQRDYYSAGRICLDLGNVHRLRGSGEGSIRPSTFVRRAFAPSSELGTGTRRRDPAIRLAELYCRPDILIARRPKFGLLLVSPRKSTHHMSPRWP